VKPDPNRAYQAYREDAAYLLTLNVGDTTDLYRGWLVKLLDKSGDDVCVKVTHDPAYGDHERIRLQNMHKWGYFGKNGGGLFQGHPLALDDMSEEKWIAEFKEHIEFIRDHFAGVTAHPRSIITEDWGHYIPSNNPIPGDNKRFLQGFGGTQFFIKELNGPGRWRHCNVWHQGTIPSDMRHRITPTHYLGGLPAGENKELYVELPDSWVLNPRHLDYVAAQPQKAS